MFSSQNQDVSVAKKQRIVNDLQERLVRAIFRLDFKLVDSIEKELGEEALGQWGNITIDFNRLNNKIVAIYPRKIPDNGPDNVSLWALSSWYREYDHAPWHSIFNNQSCLEDFLNDYLCYRSWIGSRSRVWKAIPDHINNDIYEHHGCMTVPRPILDLHNKAVEAVQKYLTSFHKKIIDKVSEGKDKSEVEAIQEHLTSFQKKIEEKENCKGVEITEINIGNICIQLKNNWSYYSLHLSTMQNGVKKEIKIKHRGITYSTGKEFIYTEDVNILISIFEEEKDWEIVNLLKAELNLINPTQPEQKKEEEIFSFNVNKNEPKPTTITGSQITDKDKEAIKKGKELLSYYYDKDGMLEILKPNGIKNFQIALGSGFISLMSINRSFTSAHYLEAFCKDNVITALKEGLITSELVKDFCLSDYELVFSDKGLNALREKRIIPSQIHDLSWGELKRKIEEPELETSSVKGSLIPAKSTQLPKTSITQSPPLDKRAVNTQFFAPKGLNPGSKPFYGSELKKPEIKLPTLKGESKPFVPGSSVLPMLNREAKPFVPGSSEPPKLKGESKPFVPGSSEPPKLTGESKPFVPGSSGSGKQRL